MSAALAIVPQPQTLYELSSELVTLLDSLDMTDEGSPERAECLADIGRYMAELPRKVDSVAAYFHHIGQQIQFAKEEITRLQSRQHSFERRRDALESYCIRVLDLLPEPKRGQKKLEGEHNTLSLRPSEGTIVRDEASIPDEYMTAAVEMPAPVWDDIVENFPGVLDNITKRELKIRLADVKKALKAGLEVPGADLEYRNHLKVS